MYLSPFFSAQCVNVCLNEAAASRMVLRDSL